MDGQLFDAEVPADEREAEARNPPEPRLPAVAQSVLAATRSRATGHVKHTSSRKCESSASRSSAFQAASQPATNRAGSDSRTVSAYRSAGAAPSAGGPPRAQARFSRHGVIEVGAQHIFDSCGYGVPLMDFQAHWNDGQMVRAKGSRCRDPAAVLGELATLGLRGALGEAVAERRAGEEEERLTGDPLDESIIDAVPFRTMPNSRSPLGSALRAAGRGASASGPRLGAGQGPDSKCTGTLVGPPWPWREPCRSTHAAQARRQVRPVRRQEETLELHSPKGIRHTPKGIRRARRARPRGQWGRPARAPARLRARTRH